MPAPDGRWLYGYRLGGEAFERLEADLKQQEVARWPMPDGGFLIEEREVVPRRWWDRLRRPIGIALILGAIGWSVIVLWHGWPRLAL